MAASHRLHTKTCPNCVCAMQPVVQRVAKRKHRRDHSSAASTGKSPYSVVRHRGQRTITAEISAFIGLMDFTGGSVGSLVAERRVDLRLDGRSLVWLHSSRPFSTATLLARPLCAGKDGLCSAAV